MARKKSNNETLTMRWPADMLALVRQLAEKEDRSVNAQFVALVREALDNRTRQPGSSSLPGAHVG